MTSGRSMLRVVVLTAIAADVTYTDASGESIKAALSAYMHFCADERGAVTTQLKEELGDKYQPKLVMSKLGELWRGLTPAVVDKYQAKAVEDKARFDRDLEANGIVPEAVAKKAAKEKKKKPLSSYMYFCQDRRPAVTAGLKASLGADFKYTAVMVKLGEEWRKADDATKAKFQEMADADKAKAF